MLTNQRVPQDELSKGGCVTELPREVSLNTSSTGESALVLIQETLALIEREPENVSAAIRNAVRIARLTDAHADLFWIRYELIDPNQQIATAELYSELHRNISGQQYDDFTKLVVDRYNEERRYETIEGSLFRRRIETRYAVQPIDEIEANLDRHRAQIVTDPDGTALLRNFEHQSLAEQYASILGRVRRRVFDFLTRVEQRLIVGHVNADIFESYRRYVDQQLSKIAPDVLKKFAAIYRRISEGDNEARSHAVTSCRRILKALADLVYPARDEKIRGTDGNEYSVDDDHFVQRLRQYVKESAGEQKSSVVLRAQIGDLESRFSALNGLSSKGAHAQVSLYEVFQCAIQTYLVTGDVLRLHATTSEANSNIPR